MSPWLTVETNDGLLENSCLNCWKACAWDW